ncbi:MAG: hypothetical protein WC876_09630 [Candidatus Thermoplasmatota archaeon]
MAPVVGTILVIIISVAIAGAAFVLFRTFIAESGDDKPVAAFTADLEQRKLIVVRAPAGFDWFVDLRIGGTCTPSLNGGPMPTIEGTPVLAGDTLQCDAGEELSVSTSIEQGNTLLHRVTFP